MRAPERRAASNIRSELARTGAEPGRHMPRASTTQCMVLAVAMPAHTPGPRMAWGIISARLCFIGLPKRSATWPENSSSMSIWSSPIMPEAW